MLLYTVFHTLCQILTDLKNPITLWFTSKFAVKNPTTLSICCHTILRNIDVRKQTTTDKLPGSVATCLRCGGVVNNQIEKGLLPSLPLEKN